MFTQSLRRALASTLAALAFTATFVGAQDGKSTLKIAKRESVEKTYNRVTPTASLGSADAFRRVGLHGASVQSQPRRRREIKTSKEAALARVRQAATAVAPQGFGTGGGDRYEDEPNDRIAQAVSLPVNIFGEISVNGDLDFFSFQALAGQQITVEPFAARLRNSLLVPDIALYDSTGRLLASAVGDEDDDPIIRYLPPRDEVLIAAISDIDDLGGPNADYLLNITRGVDVEEDEPNDRLAQSLPPLPVTIFGEVNGTSDVDFYSFVAAAGQTLILDVDAEVLGSRLDTEINLSDPETGLEFFYNDQYDGDDSRFNLVLPYTGRYVIGVGAYDSNSSGFYRLNASIVPSNGAPLITSLRRVSQKVIEVTGTNLVAASRVEVNGKRKKTSLTGSGTLRAKVKVRAGDVVTVINPPEDRRSNPLLLQ